MHSDHRYEGMYDLIDGYGCWLAFGGGSSMNRDNQVVQKDSAKVISINMGPAFFFERAVQSLDKFHYEKALKYFRKAMEFDPHNPINHCNMAGIYSELGNFQESNRLLQHVLDHIDPSMTECYYYMANNYANMEQFELAEQAITHYLEHDEHGHYLAEAEEMVTLLSYELQRIIKPKGIKSQAGMFEHEQARELLEDGRFAEATQLLEKVTKNHPDFLAAYNNLALAYYYKGQIEQSLAVIEQVLSIDRGNLHALCNLAIFYQHLEEEKLLQNLLAALVKVHPFHVELLFKLAMTLGILGEDEGAYIHFKRLIKQCGFELEPCVYHYAAVAAFNTKRYKEAGKLWGNVLLLDPESHIAKFYLSELTSLAHAAPEVKVSYQYHLPFEEQFREFEQSLADISNDVRCDPVVRSSFVWALHHANDDTKLQVIQVLGMIGDEEVDAILRDFLLKRHEDDYLKKVAVFALRTMGASDPIHMVLKDGKEVAIYSSHLSPDLPVWKEKWQRIMDISLQHMEEDYDMIQQHDLQTLWIEFLTRKYPDIPRINKEHGWSAALEYLTAKMHRRQISMQEVATKYEVSLTTVRKHIHTIDATCGLREKMNAIFPKFSGKI